MNHQRISNPFTPSSAPDWVMLRKSYVPNGHMNKQVEADTAKRGNDNVAVEPGNLPRAEVAHASDRGLLNLQEPRIETQSHGVAESSTSSYTRGPPPPIPRKPIEFVISNERNLEPSSSDRLETAADLSDQPQIVGSTLKQLSSINTLPWSDKPLPASHQWSIPSLPATNSVRLPDEPHADPTLASPKNLAQSLSGSSGLLDDDNVGALYFPSLQPIRRS